MIRLIEPKSEKLLQSLAAFIVLLAIAGASLIPAFAAGDATEPKSQYAGSDTCKMCHSKLYNDWTTTAHGKSLLATGLSEQNAGCEACHGAANPHVSSTGKTKPNFTSKTDPADFSTVCASCHAKSPDNSSPASWQKFDQKSWTRSEHTKNKVSCLGCHSGHSKSAKQLKDNPGDACVKCHPKVMNESGSNKKAAYTHMPVAQKQCTMCHDPHTSSQARPYKSGIQKVCTSCHKAGSNLMTKHSGYNVASSDCTECHDAHSHDKANSLLKGKKHGPFKSGGCSSCHKQAGAADSLELAKPEKTICLSCHNTGEMKSPNAHRPVAEGMCTTCHSPHVSKSKSGLLKKDVSALCFTCHSKIEDSVNAKFPHKPMEGGDCLACHDSHGDSGNALLKKPSIDLCKDCHKPHLHPVGKKKDGTEVIDPTTKKMLVCTSCHQPHGSDWQYLTKDNYERELCVRCHKEGMGHGD